MPAIAANSAATIQAMPAVSTARPPQKMATNVAKAMESRTAL
ncbi:MAG TPA: hypothetical protein VGJ78_16735 [Vicinamibacterales bacterium]